MRTSRSPGKVKPKTIWVIRRLRLRLVREKMQKVNSSSYDFRLRDSWSWATDSSSSRVIGGGMNPTKGN